MSLARLFLSGLLVAAGLILGAFTLHGYFEPNWAQQQMQAATRRPAEPPVISTFKGRDRFVAGRVEPSRPPANPIVKASVAAAPAPDPRAENRPSVKTAAKKKTAEKEKEKTKRPQQASAQWPWNLFSN